MSHILQRRAGFHLIQHFRYWASHALRVHIPSYRLHSRPRSSRVYIRAEELLARHRYHVWDEQLGQPPYAVSLYILYSRLIPTSTATTVVMSVTQQAPFDPSTDPARA
jgi:hypothetical protein